MPTPAGGAVSAGHYTLISETVYGASSLVGYEPAALYQFDGEGDFTAKYLDDKANRGTWSTTGTTLRLTITCSCSHALAQCTRSTTPARVELTATATQLTFFMDYVNGGVMVQTYAKR